MRSLPGTVGILVLLLPVHPTPIEAATQINLRVDDMPKQFNREIAGKDGARTVLIPAGTFMMGSTEGRADEEPVHGYRRTRSIWTNTRSRTSCFRSSCERPTI